MATNITSKGQVTLPKRVRDAMGVKPGTPVDIEYRDGCAVIRPARKIAKSKVRTSFEKVRGTMDLDGMTTDEYMKWLRGDD
ncbi:MAG: AbrB/MazE/SpoVT family DNA-binding domain-containing protein [Rhizomicrobium sp.]